MQSCDIKPLVTDCIIITWSWGNWKIRRGSIGENDDKREGRLDVKFDTYRGGITFSFLFANWKRYLSSNINYGVWNST